MPENNLTYIILEDTYYIALDIKEIVKSLRPGYRLAAVAETAVEAVSLISRDAPDLLIADTTASDGDSIRILRDAGVDIPVVFISEYSTLAPKAETFRISAFILKPVTSSDLHRAFLHIEKKRNHLNQQHIITPL